MMTDNIFKEAMHKNNMKKRLGFVLLLSIFMIGFAFAANETNSSTSSSSGSSSSNNLEGIDKAYQCLKDEIEKKSELSLQEAIFSMMALGSNSKASSVINDQKKSNEECWPKSSCTIKETSQVAIAYDKAGKSTNNVEKWLIGKNKTAKDLTWYLEIDLTNREEGECTIKYDGSDKKINIREDMTLSGSAGTCLSVSAGGYWLKIREDCLSKEFEVSCNKDFITSLIYQKGSTGTIYVSPETSSAPSLGTTSEKVESQCFGLSQNCDYESTLWGTLALYKLGYDVEPFLPYLIALSEDNRKFFPSAFLYALTGGEEFYSEIVQNQKQNKYWELTGGNGRFYDTSLAMLALSSSGATELGYAQDYLLSIQTKEGCWNNNNIRDTGFVLYSGFGRTGERSSDGGSVTSCTASGYSCEIGNECTAAGGLILRDYDCSASGGFTFCCSVDVQLQSCSQKGGLVCASNQECNGRVESSADGSCCVQGACVVKQEVDLCSASGGVCASSCNSNEIETSDSCSVSGEICCKVNNTPEPEGFGWFWVVLLIILIILVVLGIIYRHRLQIWWFKMKGRFKGSKSTQGAPPRFPPSTVMRPMPFSSPGMQRAPPRVQPRPAPSNAGKDKEMEETLRKLREMSK